MNRARNPRTRWNVGSVFDPLKQFKISCYIDVADFLNQHFIKNRDRLSRLEEDIISYRANFELCVDIYFKG